MYFTMNFKNSFFIKEEENELKKLIDLFPEKKFLQKVLKNNPKFDSNDCFDLKYMYSTFLLDDRLQQSLSFIVLKKIFDKTMENTLCIVSNKRTELEDIESLFLMKPSDFLTKYQS